MITQAFNLHLYHWVWYLIGFVLAPRLTVMILVTIYFRDILPTALIVWGWILAILANGIEVNYANRKK